MRRVALFLLASLQLARGRQPGFSVYDDLLAHPQYEVVFSNDLISEQEAAALANSHKNHPAYTATFAAPGGFGSDIQAAQDAPPLQPPAGDASDSSAPSRPSTYEYMNLDSSTRYICAIPVVAPPEPSPLATAESSQLARDEEARDLERGSENGWQLLSGMHTQCLYFMAGWWSYSFCGAREVIQFHALPRLPNGAAPPAHDPNTAAYILGQLAPTADGGKKDEWNEDVVPDWQPTKETRLAHYKGDQRYLVQRLAGGTVCDLTGRDRTIEVQYHCAPGLKNDRIAWIKEVTTCSYQMVVHTPRLCEETLFLPPPEVVTNPITCRQVVSGDIPESTSGPEQTFNIDDGATAQEGAAEKAGDVHIKAASGDKPNQANPWKGVNVGGIVIGGNRVLKKGEHQQLGGSGKNGLPAWYQRDTIVAAPVPVKKTKKKSQDDKKAGKGEQEGAEDEDTEFELHLSAKELELLGLDVGNIKNLQRQLQEMTTEDMLEIDMVQAEDGTLEYRVRLGGAEGGEGEARKDGQPVQVADGGGGGDDDDDDERQTGSEEQLYD